MSGNRTVNIQTNNGKVVMGDDHSTTVDHSRLIQYIADNQTVILEQLKELSTSANLLAGNDEEAGEVTAVNRARIAAANQDSGKVLQHLKHAGEWVLGVARDIGVNVVADIISAAINK